MLSVQVEIVCGATLPSCTTALILLAYNKQDQSTKTAVFLLVTPNFAFLAGR